MLEARPRCSMAVAVLAIAAAVGGCRARGEPTLRWKAATGEPSEPAALLLLDENGIAKRVCWPLAGEPARPLATVGLQRIWDVTWRSTPLIAAEPVAAGAQPGADGQLVLLGADGNPRSVATSVRAARFSPDGTALAYQTEVAPGASTSYVLDLASGKLTELGALVDPRWDGEGKYLYATRVRTPADGSGGQWRSLRLRWERPSGALIADGPGSAQIPAPRGDGVAWSERQLGASAAGACSVVLRREGGVRHSIVGSFCAGVADDRGVRWSADGRWLAFPHPGPVPGRRDRRGFYVDVVAIEGGRDPRLTALQRVTPADRLAMAADAGPVWFDWSPSGRFLAAQDGADELRVYDLEARATAALGQGRQPMWSPGGSYLLTLQPGPGSPLRASVRAGTAAADVTQLGPVRDARWLPPGACDGG